MTASEYVQSKRIASPVIRASVREAFESGNAIGYDEGYDKGVSIGYRYAINIMLNLSCLSLHELFGFGKDRCAKFVDKFCEVEMAKDLTDTDALIEEVDKKCGVKITLENNGLGMDE